MRHLIDHFMGLDDPGGHWYLFWSGIGADLSRVLGSLIIVGPFAWLYRHHRCTADGCRKIALHDHYCHHHRAQE